MKLYCRYISFVSFTKHISAKNELNMSLYLETFDFPRNALTVPKHMLCVY